MKITWKFVNETVEAEVEEKWAEVISELDRQERNNERKERYHCCSLDAILFEGQDYGDNNTPDTEMESADMKKRIAEALGKLTETQQRRLLMLADGLNIREIAHLENKDFKSVYESIEGAKKKFVKYF